MTTPATLSAAVVDMCKLLESATYRVVLRPSFGSRACVTTVVPPQSRLWATPHVLCPLERGPWCDHGLTVRLSSSQPRSAMSLLPAHANRHTCWLQSAAGIGWAGSRPGDRETKISCPIRFCYDLSTPSSNAVFCHWWWSVDELEACRCSAGDGERFRPQRNTQAERPTRRDHALLSRHRADTRVLSTSFATMPALASGWPSATNVAYRLASIRPRVSLCPWTVSPGAAG